MKRLIFAVMVLGFVGVGRAFDENVWQSDDIWILAEASADPLTESITRMRCNAKIKFLRTKIQEKALDKKVGYGTCPPSCFRVRTTSDAIVGTNFFEDSSWTKEVEIFRVLLPAKECHLEWTVIKGSQTYSLDEFVSSGRFCRENGGHRWDGNYTFFGDWKCIACRRSRQKTKVNKQVEQWED